jgi:pyruvate dehydrogenase E2 component (dihydrolipoamide acetyltransferase)
MAEFCMPSLGADMEKGTLVEWKVKVGDRVKRGDIIAEVETEKGIIEIEVFMDGVIEKFRVQPGDEVPVGEVMALIRDGGVQGTEMPSAALSSEPASDAAEKYPATQLPKESTEKKYREAGKEQRFKISPAARKKAEELSLDLTTVRGTGPDNAITLADVERAASVGKLSQKGAKKKSAVSGTQGSEFQLGMRRAIAAAMSRSNREIPHYYLETRMDVTGALHWLTEENKNRSVKDRLLPVVLLLKATALALTDIPALNGYWIDNHFQGAESVNIGFAIALRQGGLISPAIHNANRKSLDELMADMKDLIIRTRAGRLRSSEMTDATVTLTNLGDLGVESSFGVIYPPQVALVTFGKIMDQPWVENAMIGIRPVVKATLSGDHRATDGRTGAQFLNALDRYLQEAETL